MAFKYMCNAFLHSLSPPPLCVSLWHIHMYTVCKCYNIEYGWRQVKVKGHNTWQQQILTKWRYFYKENWMHYGRLQCNKVRKVCGEVLWFTVEVNLWEAFPLTYCRKKSLFDNKCGDVLGRACDCVNSGQQQPRESIPFVGKIILSGISWRQKTWHIWHKHCLRQCARVCLPVRRCQNTAIWWLMIVCMLVGEEVKICRCLYSESIFWKLKRELEQNTI